MEGPFHPKTAHLLFYETNPFAKGTALTMTPSDLAEHPPYMAGWNAAREEDGAIENTAEKPDSRREGEARGQETTRRGRSKRPRGARPCRSPVPAGPNYRCGYFVVLTTGRSLLAAADSGF